MAAKREGAAVFLAVLAAYVISGPSEATQHLEITAQAVALLHGHIAIDLVARVPESVVFDGRHYLINPPLGALAMMPFAAVGYFNQTFVAQIIGALTAMLVWRRWRSFELVILWAFGTNIWYEASSGDSWGFNSVVCAAAGIMAVTCAAGARGRGDPCTQGSRPGSAVAGGFWAGVACLARFDMAATLPVYLLWLREKHWVQGSPLPPAAKARLKFAMGLMGPAVIYLLWSHARFGTFYDQAEARWFSVDSWGAGRGVSMLSIRNLPFNLFTAIFMAPAWSTHFPWFRPVRWGQGIILTSPALLLAMRAPWDRRTRFLWAAAAAALTGPMLFYNNGWVQFGCRFWIQAYPFLFGLIARQRLDDRLARGLIAVSVLLCGLGVWAIRHGGFAL